MRIFVLVKQVPNTTQVKLDKKTGNLIREGVEAIMNPEDRHACQAAVDLKAQLGSEVEATAISMGPPQSVDVLTEALGMGLDKGLLLTDRLFAGADTWATSSVLAKAVDYLAGDDKSDVLVLAGRQAIDGDTAQIGPQVAEATGLNQATYVTGLSAEGGQLKVTRQTGAGAEELELKLPALLTVLGELNEPRPADLARLLAACEPGAPIKAMNAADLGLKVDEIGLAGSLTHVVKTFSPKSAREGEMLDGPPAEMAAKLVDRLTEAKLLAGGN